MTEDKKYPIYRVDIRWIEDDVDNHREKYESTKKQSAVLPPGRRYNSSSGYRMFREKKEPRYIVTEAKEAWKGCEKYQARNPELIDITVKFIIKESWCLEWFCHWTFDDGQDDAEILASFQRYVDRMQRHNRKHGRKESYGWIDVICLMGAEDRWRWRGMDDAEAPCRCEGCKKNKVIRIVH